MNYPKLEPHTLKFKALILVHGVSTTLQETIFDEQ